MNKTMVIGLSVLLCLYLAFGLMGCKADEAVYPNHESTEIYRLRVTTGSNLEFDAGIFATAEECASAGAYRQYKGKIRIFLCIPGRGVRPGN